MKVTIVGGSSPISHQLEKLLKKGGHDVNLAGRQEKILFDANRAELDSLNRILDQKSEAYIINIGTLNNKSILNQTLNEIEYSIHVNLISIVRLCEIILTRQDACKIFIIGSESGKKGSFDTTYFLSKASLRAYVRQRHILKPNQQLILFSPSTISDAGMTIRRNDRDRLASYEESHPKKRFLNSFEFASIICGFLEPEWSYISNTEIEINGGKFARMNYI